MKTVLPFLILIFASCTQGSNSKKTRNSDSTLSGMTDMNNALFEKFRLCAGDSGAEIIHVSEYFSKEMKNIMVVKSGYTNDKIKIRQFLDSFPILELADSKTPRVKLIESEDVFLVCKNDTLHLHLPADKGIIQVKDASYKTDWKKLDKVLSLIRIHESTDELYQIEKRN